jgi:hypothetical protein
MIGQRALVHNIGENMRVTTIAATILATGLFASVSYLVLQSQDPTQTGDSQPVTPSPNLATHGRLVTEDKVFDGCETVIINTVPFKNDRLEKEVPLSPPTKQELQERNRIKRALVRGLGMSEQEVDRLPIESRKLDAFYAKALEEIQRVGSINRMRIGVAMSLVDKKVKDGDYLEGEFAHTEQFGATLKGDLLIDQTTSETGGRNAHRILVRITRGDSDEMDELTDKWFEARLEARRALIELLVQIRR